MTKAGYITDIILRSFFIFIAAFLVASYTVRGFALSVVLALIAVAGINLLFEATIGKKYRRAFAAAPKKPRRKPKQVLKELWQRIFSRDKTKGFVWAGIVILLMSFVVRLNIYYVVFACALFTLAAISRFAPLQARAIIQNDEGNKESGETIGENPTGA